MLFKLARVSSLLLSSALALVNHSSRLEEQIVRRYQARQASDNSGVEGVDQVPNTQWAGVALTKAEGTFTSVTGTFTVPTISGYSDDFAAIFVGIGGFNCGSSVLQTGVDAVVDNDAPGGEWYTAWYGGISGSISHYPGMEISAGQTIMLNVTVQSPTSGITIIENLTTGQAMIEEVFFDSSDALCQLSAEWVVQDFKRSTVDQVDTYANFGAVTFTNAIAAGPEGTYTLCNSTGTDLGVLNPQNYRDMITKVDSDCNIIVSYV